MRGLQVHPERGTDLTHQYPSALPSSLVVAIPKDSVGYNDNNAHLISGCHSARPQTNYKCDMTLCVRIIRRST